MLRETDLTLEKALDICRAEEQSKTGLQVMDQKQGAAVDALRKEEHYGKIFMGIRQALSKKKMHKMLD